MTIKFDRIAWGASYYFNINWSPGVSRYLGVSHYGTYIIYICTKCTFSDSDKSRGFGYVQYSLREDADAAIQKIKALDGRKLYVSFANKKPKQTRGKKTEVVGSDSDGEEGIYM